MMRARLHELMNGMLAVGAVLLLLGCANVTNILLAHSVRHQHDRALRLALGASRARLVQQVLTETVVLATVGAAVGVVVAAWLKEVLVSLLLPELFSESVRPRVPLDGPVLMTALGAAVSCGVLVGVVPAWLGTHGRLADTLAHAGHRVTLRSPTLRMGLAVVQLALSVALVTSALLLITSVRNLGQVELGFDPQHVSIHTVGLHDHGYTAADALPYNRALLERVRADGSFQAVSISSGFPFSPRTIERLRPPGDEGNAEPIPVRTILCTDGFPDVLGMRLRMGRFFTPDEVLNATSLPVDPVVLSDSLARRLFGDALAVGRRVTMAGRPARELEVIGVMHDVRATSLREGLDPVMYLPMHGDDMRVLFPVVLARSAGAVRAAHNAVAAAAMAIDPSLPVNEPLALPSLIARGTAKERAFAWVLSLLGIVGAILAGVGLYGLLMQSVRERRRELGIRIAVGAAQGDILRLVLRGALWLCIVGTGMGLLLAGLSSGLLEAYLFGVTGWDPRVYAGAAAGLAFVVVVASLWPAVAATRVNPVEILRTE